MLTSPEILNILTKLKYILNPDNNVDNVIIYGALEELEELSKCFKRKIKMQQTASEMKYLKGRKAETIIIDDPVTADDLISFQPGCAVPAVPMEDYINNKNLIGCTFIASSKPKFPKFMDNLNTNIIKRKFGVDLEKTDYKIYYGSLINESWWWETPIIKINPGYLKLIVGFEEEVKYDKKVGFKKSFGNQYFENHPNFIFQGRPPHTPNFAFDVTEYYFKPIHIWRRMVDFLTGSKSLGILFGVFFISIAYIIGLNFVFDVSFYYFILPACILGYILLAKGIRKIWGKSK